METEGGVEVEQDGEADGEATCVEAAEPEDRRGGEAGGGEEASGVPVCGRSGRSSGMTSGYVVVVVAWPLVNASSDNGAANVMVRCGCSGSAADNAIIALIYEQKRSPSFYTVNQTEDC